MLPALRRRTSGLQEQRMQSPFELLRNWTEAWPWNGTPWPEPLSEDGLTAAYPVDISEENGQLIVDAEIPGFTKDQIEVEVENGMLHICAERKSEEPKGKSHLHERHYKRVERIFNLPAGVDAGKSKAKYENGVLHLTLPKTEVAKANKIAIS